MPDPPKYVQKGTFDVDPDIWECAKEEIRQVLVKKARSKATIAYSDLVAEVNALDFDPHEQKLFSILGQISIEEFNQGRPLLSVIVVHKHGDQQPGPGYFELAESLGRDVRDKEKAWVDEVIKVYECWK